MNRIISFSFQNMLVKDRQKRIEYKKADISRPLQNTGLFKQTLKSVLVCRRNTASVSRDSCTDYGEHGLIAK